MIKFNYSEIKNSNEANQLNTKSKMKKYIFIFLLLFIGLNVSNYFSEYKKYVLNAPEKLQDARKEFTKAYMFHLYYASCVRFFSIDFQNPILKVFKIPRDYFYQKALEKLPDNEAEKALYFELFEAKPYNFSIGGKYGSMAKHYGVDFSKEFIDKVYENIKILSTQKIDSSFTNDISSIGTELTFDVNFLRFYAPAEIGFRVSYLPEIQDTYFNFLFSINLTSF